MFKRALLAGIVAVLVAGSSGCNAFCQFHDNRNPRQFCGPSCGEFYWSEWFNDPPDCRDPCNNCGRFGTCRRHPLRHKCDPYYWGEQKCDSGAAGGPTVHGRPAVARENDAPPEMTGPPE
jgi:hypothetical protein